MTTKLSTEFRHILDAYSDALNMPSPLNDELLENIESDLANAGVAGVVAGKRMLREYYECKLNRLGNSNAFLDSQANELKRNIFEIDFQIEVLLGKVSDPELDHPASRELHGIIYGHGTITEGRVRVYQKIVKKPAGLLKFREYAIEIRRANAESIILFKEDLASMLALIINNKPD